MNDLFRLALIHLFPFVAAAVRHAARTAMVLALLAAIGITLVGLLYPSVAVPVVRRLKLASVLLGSLFCLLTLMAILPSGRRFAAAV